MFVLRWFLGIFGLNPRGLFRYSDGRRFRRVDPLEITRRLFSDPKFDWDETPKLLQTGQSMIQLDAFGIIGAAVRRAFEIPPVDRGGLTDIECLDLLTRFRDYLGDVKKNGSLFPISPESMASGSSPDLEIFPTRPGSGFGLIGKEPSTVPLGSPADPTPSSFPKP